MFGKRSDQQRTSEDRARAAADRAARRAGRALPPEAFEHTVRPPDLEPHEPYVHEDPPEPPREEFVPPRDEVEPPRDEIVSAPPREELAPAREEAVTPHEEVELPRDEIEPPREEFVPARDEAVTPRDEVEPPRDEVDEYAAPRDEIEPPRDEVEPRDEDVAPAPQDDLAPPREDEVPAAEAPAPPRDEDVAAPPAAIAASDIAPRDEIHQPTVEYTPFQTEEHSVPEAPLGSPRDDEPRLVAARGVPRAENEVHAYAVSRTDTTDHEMDFDTGEHRAPEETEARPPVPLRSAPERAGGAVARRRPAPNAPRRRPPAPKGPRPSGGAHWGGRIVTLIVLLIVAAALYVANATFQPFHGEGSGNVAVTIPENTDTARIGEILAAKGVVDSARFFRLDAAISGDDLRPGRYTLKKGMTNGDAIAALSKVPEAPKAAVETVKVTLVEGPSRKENAPVVDKSKKVEGSYARASSSKTTLRRIRTLGAPKDTKTAEGFLFPATYEVTEGATAGDLVKQQLDAFEENFKSIDMKYAKSKNLSRYDVLIIASMIEREAQLARERALVSAVIYNRLKEGMPLAIDATTRYSTNNWQRPILQSQLDKQEPYNTRLNRGLPPTPIGNPGLASIKAAAKPSKKSYLFYVRKPGKSGEHAFSSTDAQFARDVAKYQASREGK